MDARFTKNPLQAKNLTLHYTQDELLKSSKHEFEKNTLCIDDKQRVVILKSQEEEVLQYVHDIFNHSSERSMHLALKEYVHIKNFEKKSEEIVNECGKCQQYKPVTRQKKELHK